MCKLLFNLTLKPKNKLLPSILTYKSTNSIIKNQVRLINPFKFIKIAEFTPTLNSSFNHKASRYNRSPDRKPLKKKIKSLPDFTHIEKLTGIRKSKEMLQVVLSPLEAKLCKLLLEACQFIQLNDESKKVELRFAGGWVRDKLLGLDSDDIDVAIDSMTGEEFVKHLRTYMETQGKALGTIGRIASNPDKSKHLETVTISLFGLDIDFVNLRSETYSEHSRIPDIEFGTPYTDALRRDITINALFFNIHSGQVEDFTEKGLADLSAGIIRTPLEPKDTFADDPLRMLRCVRFASRFDFTIEDEALEAMQEPSVKEVLKVKISKERVGMELLKILKGGRPLKAFETLYTCALYETLFFPSPLSPEDSTILPTVHGLTVCRAMTWLLNSITTNQIQSPFLLTSLPIPSLQALDFNTRLTQKGLLIFTGYMYPFKEVRYEAPKKPRPTHAFTVMCRETIKWPMINATYMVISYELADQLTHLLSLPSTQWNRSNIGMFMYEAAEHFYPATCLYICMTLAPHISADNALIPSTELDVKMHKLGELLGYIGEQQLLDISQTPHLLSGKEITSTLTLKPSKLTGYLKTEVLKWQLINPSGTKPECEQWLRNTFSNTQALNDLAEQYEHVRPLPR